MAAAGPEKQRYLDEQQQEEASAKAMAEVRIRGVGWRGRDM